jgi:hypothetical protein
VGLIDRNLNAQGRPTLRYGGAIETLADSLARGECLPFLGAGMGLDENAPVDLPRGWELAKTMIEEIGLVCHEQDRLATAAFYYEFFRGGRQALNRLLLREIANPEIKPSRAIHNFMKVLRIAEANKRNTVIATTNYDQHFEQAYRAEFGCLPATIVYQGAWNPLDRDRICLNIGLNGELDLYGTGWYPTKPTTLYKIHGCISLASGKRQNLVITEEDYINFLANSLASFNGERRLLTHFTARLQRSRILFIGYSLEDWNFRTLFKSTAEQREDTEFSYAVQFYPQSPAESQEQKDRRQATVDFWHDKRVEILNVRAHDFLDDLLRVMPAAAPAGVGP